MQFFQMRQAVFTPTSTVPSQHASVHGNFQVGNLKVKPSVQPLVSILTFCSKTALSKSLSGSSEDR